MFLEESKWVTQKIKEIPNIKNILDIGSGNLYYRKQKQSYISDMYHLIGTEIDTLDLIEGEGIDYALDITNEGCYKGLEKYSVVLVCNLLEHIPLNKLDSVLGNIYMLLNTDGYCIVTVPFNIGFHPSPIDNGFRPNTEELGKVFSYGFEEVVTQKVICSHYREPYISNTSLLPLPEVTCGVFKKKDLKDSR